MDDYNFNERIREKIRITIEKSNTSSIYPMPEKLTHMLTQICFEMYRSGIEHGIKLAKDSINKIEKKIK